jgi:nucleotide-binding universal stress UspA family protein
VVSIRTVLCPVDFSPASPRQVKLAADVCRAFDARLVLHHNLAELAAGAAVGWMWAADHHAPSESHVELRLRELLDQFSPREGSEARLTHGPAVQAVVAVSDAVDADLVVLSTHGADRGDHASVTHKVLEQSRRAVLALHEPEIERRMPAFGSMAADRQVVLVPTDLTPESAAAVALAFDLARAFPMEPHLLHLVSHGGRESHPGEMDAARQRLLALVPDEFVGRARLHVEHDDPARGIAHMAERLDAACIVMGEHTRAPLRRWFSRDTSGAVLHRAPCPVWYVPGGRAA